MSTKLRISPMISLFLATAIAVQAAVTVGQEVRAEDNMPLGRTPAAIVDG